MLFITGCGADNDFVKLLSDNGIGFKLASTASALTEASFGDAVAILAGAYPCGKTGSVIAERARSLPGKVVANISETDIYAKL